MAGDREHAGSHQVGLTTSSKQGIHGSAPLCGRNCAHRRGGRGRVLAPGPPAGVVSSAACTAGAPGRRDHQPHAVTDRALLTTNEAMVRGWARWHYLCSKSTYQRLSPAVEPCKSAACEGEPGQVEHTAKRVLMGGVR